eukprot:3172831-Alexandrium_andersonii.AAC.1
MASFLGSNCLCTAVMVSMSISSLTPKAFAMALWALADCQSPWNIGLRVWMGESDKEHNTSPFT